MIKVTDTIRSTEGMKKGKSNILRMASYSAISLLVAVYSSIEFISSLNTPRLDLVSAFMATIFIACSILLLWSTWMIWRLQRES